MVEIGANVPVCVAPELAIFFGVREVRGGGGEGVGGRIDKRNASLEARSESIQLGTWCDFSRRLVQYLWYSGAVSCCCCWRV